MSYLTISAIALTATWIWAIWTKRTCYIHHYFYHGTTHHMAHDLRTGKFIGWERDWIECQRCGAKKKGRKRAKLAEDAD